MCIHVDNSWMTKQTLTDLYSNNVENRIFSLLRGSQTYAYTARIRERGSKNILILFQLLKFVHTILPLFITPFSFLLIFMFEFIYTWFENEYQEIIRFMHQIYVSVHTSRKYYYHIKVYLLLSRFYIYYV